MTGSDNNNTDTNTSTVPEHWVFGYGSLMWRPGFDYLHRQAAMLVGYHRALSVYSHIHRGTAQQPGLVFGLDHGGSCHGIAYSIAPENWQKTVEYLRAREQVTAVYLESNEKITLTEDGNRPVKALTYLVDRNHQQYAGRLGFNQQLELINQGTGQSGKCRDYVIATASHLEELGVEDEQLQALAKTLSGR